MVGYGYIDSKIVKIPEDKIISLSKNIRIETTSESGTIIIPNKKCNLVFEIVALPFDNNLISNLLKVRKLFLGISINSTQLTTNVDYIAEKEIREKYIYNIYENTIIFYGTANYKKCLYYENILVNAKECDYIRIHGNGVLLENIELKIKDLTNK